MVKKGKKVQKNVVISVYEDGKVMVTTNKVTVTLGLSAINTTVQSLMELIVKEN